METCKTDSGASSCLEAQWSDNGSAKCVTNVHLVGLQNQNWHAPNVLGILRRHWESTQDHNVTSWIRLAVICGAAGVEREQPSSLRNLANRVLGVRGLRSTHVASVCCRVVGIPKRIEILDHQNCSRSKHGQGGSKATKGTTATGLG